MMASTNDDSDEYVFVASYWNKKAGRRIYASSYGKKAFKIRVRKNKKQDG